MIISLSFSGVIYQETITELERGFRMMELRHQAEEMKIPFPKFFPGDLKIYLHNYAKYLLDIF